MTRAEYRRLRRIQRAWKHTRRQLRHYNDMADSRLVVQIEADAEALREMQRRIDQLTEQLPGRGTDPLGFAPMYRAWKIRRSHVEYRCRQRRKDAERMARAMARREMLACA